MEDSAPGRNAVLASRTHQDAILRNLQVLCESTQRIDESLKQRHPEIDWKSIAQRPRHNHTPKAQGSRCWRCRAGHGADGGRMAVKLIALGGCAVSATNQASRIVKQFRNAPTGWAPHLQLIRITLLDKEVVVAVIAFAKFLERPIGKALIEISVPKFGNVDAPARVVGAHPTVRILVHHTQSWKTANELLRFHG